MMKANNSLKRDFNLTGKNIMNRIGLGTFSLRDSNEIEIKNTIFKYLEMGGRYIDTAPFYGNRKIEMILGDVLKEINTPVFIATKIGYLQNQNDYKNPLALRDQFLRSYELLNEKVNLLQIHEADWDLWWKFSLNDKTKTVSDLINNMPIIKTLEEVNNQGYVKYIGITGNNSDKIYRIANSYSFDSVLIAKQYDLLWRNATTDLCKLTEDRNLFFAVGAPFHQGKLLNLTQLIHDNSKSDKELAEQARKLNAIIKDYNLNPLDTCIKFLLKDHRIDVIVLGVKDAYELNWLQNFDEEMDDNIYNAINSLGLLRPPSLGIPFEVRL